MTLRAFSTFGQGATVPVNTCTVTIPASGAGGTVVAGDVATLYMLGVSTGGNTMTTPTTSGGAWSQLHAPQLLGTTTALVNTYRKPLTAGDITAGTISVPLTGFMRLVGVLAIESGVTNTGSVSSFATETGDITTPTLPALTATAGAGALASLARRIGTTPAATVGLPAGWTLVVAVTSGYASAGEASLVIGRQTVASAGPIGGGVGSSSPATRGVNTVTSMPQVSASAVNAGLDQTGKEPNETVTLTGTGDTWAQISGSPTVTLVGTGTTRTFTAPKTLAGVTLGFRNSQTGFTSDDMTVAILPSAENIQVAGAWAPGTVKYRG